MPASARATTLLLLPKNDPESLLINRLADKLGITREVSTQPHGATLQAEPRLFLRLEAAAERIGTRRLVIVEIPGVEEEALLASEGWQIQVIDHHRYTQLDRSAPRSSLFQFLEFFGVTDEELRALGFDPELVAGVGLLDEGFLHALSKAGWGREAIARAVAFYEELKIELDPAWKEVRVAARAAWEKRSVDERTGVVVVRGEDPSISLREAVSFLLHEETKEGRIPSSLILEGDGRVALQDHPAALTLFQEFGGYVFGGDRCWGKSPKDGRPQPSIDMVLARVAEYH